jgi:BirA family biotin operon repressor/biotin-[acetyl-CoA-carboxylase] ligase
MKSFPAGYRLVAFESLDSTNEQARRLAMDGTQDGTVVWAKSQSAGRGRQGRPWLSPEGNLYCSIVIRPEVPAGDAAQLSFVTALALVQAVVGLLPDHVEMRYKWPNDLLLDGRKAGGILLESSGSTDGGLDWLIVGAGLNVDHYPAVTNGYPATSLRAVGVGSVGLRDILNRYIYGFAQWRTRWQKEGIVAVREAWLERAAQLGEDITVRQPSGQLTGRFFGLDEVGALLLDLPDGSRRTISAGDVFF